MKKLIILITLLLVMGLTYNMARADDGILSAFPDVKEGFAWDLNHDTNKLLSLTSIDIVKWGKGKLGMTEDKLSLGGGFLTDFDNTNIPCATLNYKIGGLEKFGFSYPLANLINIEIGAFAGKDFNGDGDWRIGLQASIMKFKF